MPGKGPLPYHLLDFVEQPFRTKRALDRRIDFIRASHKAFRRRSQIPVAQPTSQESCVRETESESPRARSSALDPLGSNQIQS